MAPNGHNPNILEMWMEQTVIYPCHEILLNNKKEHIIDMYNLKVISRELCKILKDNSKTLGNNGCGYKEIVWSFLVVMK